jgi:O-antigen/teichoic acid export membrane protein
MGIVVRQSVKSVLVTLAGSVLGALVTILSMRYFLRAEFGFTKNLITIAIQISYLGLFGFNATLLIYGQKFPPGHKLRGSFLSICALAPVVFSLMICLLWFLFKERFLSFYKAGDAALIRKYFILFPVLSLLSVGVSWFEGYLQSLHKTALQNFAREILARLIYIGLILCYALNWLSFGGFLWTYVILYLIPLAFLVLIAKRNKGLVFNWERGAFSSAEIREFLRFSGYHMLTVISSVLILQLDVVLLGPLAKDGLEAVAIYGVAALAVSMLRNPTRVIGIAATPSFSQHYQEGKIKELRTLFLRSSVNMQILGFAMFILAYLNINSIQVLAGLVQSGYSQIKGIILILMIGQLADMITGLNYELIGVTKYYRFNFWIAIALLIIVFILNYFLIRHIGIYGAAWATSIGLVMFNIAKSIFLWRKFRMQPFQKSFWLILLAAGLSWLVAWSLPYLANVWVDLVLRSALMILVFGALLLWWKISPELNELTRNVWYKKKLF